jgi:hypothetical protein
MGLWTLALVIYAAGVILGLILLDDAWPERLGVAFAWPLALAIFAGTVAVLLLALPIARPRVGIVYAVIGAIVAWIWLGGFSMTQ